MLAKIKSSAVVGVDALPVTVEVIGEGTKAVNIPWAGNNAWNIEAHILSGPSVRATNETERENVRVTHEKVGRMNRSFEYRFQPHSFTALELTRN